MAKKLEFIAVYLHGLFKDITLSWSKSCYFSISGIGIRTHKKLLNEIEKKILEKLNSKLWLKLSKTQVKLKLNSD